MNSPHTSDTWIGRLLGAHQRYRLERRLGKGGMGDVFLATDTLLGKQVALKLIKDALVGSEELKKRFEREVAVCAALKSDHIVEVNDYGVTPEGYPFYVMEYLHGQTLGQLLRQEKRLTVERTVSIISQVCQGLLLAHAGVTLWRDGAIKSGKIKVIHRDLKPENIFLVRTTLGELVKVLDFGIAKIRDDQAENTNLTHTFLGTFRYASPEQLGVAKDLDVRSDIYSLGIILYEMLSGTDPFSFGISACKRTEVEWAKAHVSKPPIPLRSQPGLEHLSQELEAVVMRCLQKLPNERFVSVDELNRALQSAVKSGISNIPQTPTLLEQGSDDSTVNRPIAALKQAVPDLTLAQPLPNAPGSNDSTVNRPLAPKQGVPGATIAQFPTPPQPRVPDATIAQIAPTQQPSRSFLTRFLLPLSIGFGVGLATMGGIYAYFQSQPHQTTVLDEIQNLKIQGKYEDCITKAETIEKDSSPYADAQKLLNECRLEHANQLAVGKNFIEAIATAKKIPESSSLHQAAQESIARWSKQVDNSI